MPGYIMLQEENPGIAIVVNTVILGACGDSWQSPLRRIMYKISTVELLLRQLGSQINSGIQC